MNDTPKIFPTTRFTPDTDENGHILMDKGQYKSGVLEVKLYSVEARGQAREVGSVTVPMSYKKYEATREDIDTLAVEELQKYFPELAHKEDTDKKSESVKTEKSSETDAQIAALQKQLDEALAEANSNKTEEKKEKEDEKTPAPESETPAGKTDGKTQK